MTDGSPSPSPSPSPSSTIPATTTWRLPVGIEDDIEQALVKTALGALVGGVAGIVCFRGGKGFRAASVATGVGAALGSTCERVRFRYNGAGNHRINNNNN